MKLFMQIGQDEIASHSMSHSMREIFKCLSNHSNSAKRVLDPITVG